MVTIQRVPHALVPVDSEAAAQLSAPNYDEFQSDREVWDLLQTRPSCVLRITMAHCDAGTPDAIGSADSEESLERAAANAAELVADARTREVRDVLWVYEIVSPKRPAVRQIGLGGMACTAEIRTPANPGGSIIRNERIRESKARGRARLIEHADAIVDAVNIAIDDATGAFLSALEAHADSVYRDLETVDEADNRHRVWLIEDVAVTDRFRDLLAREPLAYVADGNHRSAAAAMLGYESFVAVFFPLATMTIAPYNRLVGRSAAEVGDLAAALEPDFDIDEHAGAGPFQPLVTHEIGLYDGQHWLRLRPRRGASDPDDAVQDIDADIVQRRLFGRILGITDPADDRITFVGGDRTAGWLQEQVDAGLFRYAVTLPAVSIDQFVRVCVQNRLMPPKSTWFEPKIRSGLVMALLDGPAADPPA